MSNPQGSTYTANIQITSMLLQLNNIIIRGLDPTNLNKVTQLSGPLLIYNIPTQSDQVSYYQSTNAAYPDLRNTTTFNFNIPCQVGYGNNGIANIDILYSPLYPDPNTQSGQMDPVSFRLKSVTLPAATVITFKVTSGSMSMGKGYYDNRLGTSINAGNIAPSM